MRCVALRRHICSSLRMPSLDIPRTNQPWVHSPFFEEELAQRTCTPAQREQAIQFNRDGFLVIRGLADDELVERIRDETAPLFETEAAERDRRIQDAWRLGATGVGELAAHPAVLELLECLYDRPAIPFQTLTFRQGSQQRGHADSMHFSALPPKYMCGVWVALEDVDASNGPLFYHPGSHLLPELSPADLAQTVDEPRYDLYEEYQAALMGKLGNAPIELHAKKGDALLWSSNIVHGGRPIRDAGSTRWSQVTHYYFEGGIYYTPIFSDIIAGELVLKEIIDIRTGARVPHRFNDREVQPVRLQNGRYHLGMDDGCLPLDLLAARARVAELESEVATLRASRAYRVGNSVLEPTRRIGAMVRSRRAGLKASSL